MAENSIMPENVGYLTVQVSTASQALPVKDANVIVSKNKADKEEILNVLTTDRNGKTKIIELEAPAAENSLTPGNETTYYSYNVRVDYPGYYTAEYIGIPVFAGNNSIQQVNLVPLPMGQERGKKMVIVEEEPDL